MTTEEKIWSFLKAQGLTDAGAAGLMGNLYAESGLSPVNLQNTYEKKLGYTDETYTAAVDSGSYHNFAGDGAGYGLAQWTYWSRKEALLAFAKSAGRSIGDLDMQLDFLMRELSGGYRAVLDILRTVVTVRTASDAVLVQFERPADQSEAAKARRAGYGQTYYDRYAGTASAGETIYTVVAGDTLSKIAAMYCTTYQTLAACNGISDPNVIRVGQKIRIPGAVTAAMNVKDLTPA